MTASGTDLVWITHPDLPGQDVQVPRAALGAYAGGRWQVRADQVVAPESPAAPSAPLAPEPGPSATSPERPADDVAPTTPRTRKGNS